MSPGESQIYNKLLEIESQQATIIANQKNDRTDIDDNSKAIEEMVAVRNKAVGVMWLCGIIGGTGILATIGAIIVSWITGRH